MKNYFKTLLALMLALVAVFAFAGYAAASAAPDADTAAPTIPEPDDFEDTEDYRIRFVYSYKARVVNSNGRTEEKKEVKTVTSIYVPADNNGLTDEQKAQIANISYNGYKFEKWYSEWDIDTQTGVGDEFVIPEGKITSDITVYGARGNLAGDNVTWSVAPKGFEGTPTADDISAASDLVIIFSGTGAMFDFANANEIDIPWYKYVNKVTGIIIGDGVTTVGANAFNGFTKLYDIDFGTTVESINTLAFSGCSSAKFKTLKTPASLKNIGVNAFRKTKLKEVILNDGLETIQDSAFQFSNGIRTIYVPASLKSVGNAAFHPGSNAGANLSHALSKVYYGSDDPAKFAAIDVSMDNSWFNESPTIYYYTEDEAKGNDTTANIAYWHYAEVNGVKTEIPVQYCYTVKYFISTLATPIVSFRIPVSAVLVPDVADGAAVGESVNMVPAVDEDGVIMLEGVVTADIVAAQKEIVYDGYKFDWTSGGLQAGDIITDDKEITCKRGDILSNYGGVRWKYSAGKITITIDPTAADRVRADVASLVASGDIAANKAAEEVEARLATIYRIWDFDTPLSAQATWTGNSGVSKEINAVEIGDGVEYLGANIFSGLVNLHSVNLPASLLEINATAFDGCSKLVAIYSDSTDPAACKGLLVENSLSCALKNTVATVYAKAYGPTAENGNYWLAISTKKTIAWSLREDGSIVIGGSDAMADFTTPESTPWAGARERITSVAFANNITELGENVVNGCSNVTSITLPSDLRKIPASSLAGTKVVNDTAAYEQGLLIIGGHLIKVDAARRNTELFELPIGVLTIAEGAFAGCDDIERVYISQTLAYINNGAFPANNSIETVYVDATAGAWKAITKDCKSAFADADVYYKSDVKPAANAEGEYYYKSGREYIIWGCDHVFGEWIETEDGETRFCIYDDRHFEVKAAQ